MTPARAVGLLLVAAAVSGLYVAVTADGLGRATASLLGLVAGVAGMVTLLESRRATAETAGSRVRPGRHRL
jgi:hypothetical protein